MVWTLSKRPIYNSILQQSAVLPINLSNQLTPECEWIDTSKFMKMGKLCFCVEIIMWSSISLILIRHATLVNDGDYVDAITHPHLAWFFFRNTHGSILSHVAFCPEFPHALYPHQMTTENQAYGGRYDRSFCAFKVWIVLCLLFYNEWYRVKLDPVMSTGCSIGFQITKYI